MKKNRLEAFSDGVFAIIITIMVLELKVPLGDDYASLTLLFPKFIGYILSFIYVGIYWNNHHHLLYTVQKVNGGILWANLFVLFWLSILPFATAWAGESHFASFPLMFYGFVLLMSAISYTILALHIVKHHGKDSLLARAIGNDYKGKISLVLYCVAIAVANFYLIISGIIYIIVALMWLIPDSRIEKAIEDENEA